MKVISTEKISVNSGTTKEVKFNGGNPGDTSVAECYIQTLDNVSFTVTGVVKENEDGISMKLINMGTFEKVTNPTQAGLYLLMSGSLQSAQINFNGTGEVIIKKVF